MHERLESQFLKVALELRFNRCFELMLEFAQKVLDFNGLSIDANRYKAQA